MSGTEVVVPVVDQCECRVAGDIGWFFATNSALAMQGQGGTCALSITKAAVDGSD